MKEQAFRLDPDGFNGAWYPASSESGRGLILMLGDSAEDYMARTGAKWLNRQGIHVMAMSADKKDYGHHSYPLEMCCGTPADISAGWKNVSRDILMTASMNAGSMSTEHTLRFPSPC